MIRVSHNCDMGSFLGQLVRGLRLVDLNLSDFNSSSPVSLVFLPSQK